MKVVIAPDSFKESMTAKQVCQSIETGLRRVWETAEIIHVPVADGGEGTVQSLVDATNGTVIYTSVTGPLGSLVEAYYGLLGDGETAVIEMAAASGLHHVPLELRDPKMTTSYGTGELILHALERGVKKIIIGLGGSATNDAGIGMLAALGVNFLDKNRNPVSINGNGILAIEEIDLTHFDPRFIECEILVACDVDNPLCGVDGASATFGPQKGATESDIVLLDEALQHFANLTFTATGKNIRDIPGAGAAGGMGAALIGYSQAALKPGVDIVMETVELAKYLASADLVITGEGRIDWQTVHGKTPIGVAKEAKKHNLNVIAVAGCLGKNYQEVFNFGIDSVFCSVPRALDLATAFKEADQNLANLAENIARLWNANH